MRTQEYGVPGEYFLREFKKQLEKGNSALKRGHYIVQGLKEMR